MRILTCCILSFALCSCQSLLPRTKTAALCSSSDMEYAGDCLPGKSLQAALKQLKADTGLVSILEEPPLILRGLTFSQGDSCSITLYIERTVIPQKQPVRSFLSYILHKKVTGCSWSKPLTHKSGRSGITIPYYKD